MARERGTRPTRTASDDSDSDAKSSSSEDISTSKKLKRQGTGRSQRSRHDAERGEPSSSEGKISTKKPKRQDTGRSQSSRRDVEIAEPSSFEDKNPSKKPKRRDTGRSKSSRRDVEEAEPSRSERDAERETPVAEAKFDADDDLVKAMQQSKLDEETRKTKQPKSWDDDEISKAIAASKLYKHAAPSKTSDDSEEQMRQAMELSLQDTRKPVAVEEEDDDFKRMMEESRRIHKEAQQRPSLSNEDFDAQIRQAMDASKQSAEADAIAAKEKRHKQRMDEKDELRRAKDLNMQDYKMKQATRKAFEMRENDRRGELQEEREKQRRAARQLAIRNQNQEPERHEPGDDDPRMVAMMARAMQESIGDPPPQNQLEDEGVVKPEDSPPTYTRHTPQGEKRGNATKFVSSSSDAATPGTWKTITPEIQQKMKQQLNHYLYYFEKAHEDWQCPEGSKARFKSRPALGDGEAPKDDTALLLHGGTIQGTMEVLARLNGPLAPRADYSATENPFAGARLGQGTRFDRVRDLRTRLSSSSRPRNRL